MNPTGAAEMQVRSDEASRLAALDSYEILDTPPEDGFDRIAALAARLFRVPIALVSLVAADRQWFKARVGLEPRETGRDIAFCAHAIRMPEVMVVLDATRDPRFAANPLVTGEPNIRFYAGAPLRNRAGHTLGTLCILDHVPRAEFSRQERDDLAQMAAIAVDQLELRLANTVLTKEAVSRAEIEEALRRAMAEVAAAERAKSAFLAGTTHDMRQPLTVMLASLEMLEENPALPPSCRTMTARAIRAAERMDTAFARLLEVSHLQSGQLEATRAAFPAADFLSELIEAHRQTAADRDVTLSLATDAAPACFYSDPEMLRTVIDNLLGNAIRYTDPGGRVWIDCVEIRPGFCRIGTHDTGIGIAPDKIDQIFEEFRRLAPSRGEGMGLGLSIVRRTAEILGHPLTVTSEIRKGSCFAVDVPIAAD